MSIMLDIKPLIKQGLLHRGSHDQVPRLQRPAGGFFCASATLRLQRGHERILTEYMMQKYNTKDFLESRIEWTRSLHATQFFRFRVSRDFMAGDLPQRPDHQSTQTPKLSQTLSFQRNP